MLNDISKVATEWLNSNLNKSYPFADSTACASGVLPTVMFVDALMQVSGEIDRSCVYINKVNIGSAFIELGLGAKNLNGDSITFDGSINISRSLPFGSVVRFSLADSTRAYGVYGSITVGNLSCASTLSSAGVYSEQNASFFIGCVHQIDPEFITGFIVDGELYTGNIELVAGDGIDISVDTNANGNTEIIIKSLNYAPPSQNMTITSDSELMNSLINTYGKPIRTINNVYPDESNGNISLAVKSNSSEEGTIISAKKLANGALLLYDTTDNKGCLDDSTITTITNGLKELNNRASELDKAITAIDTDINTINAQLARIN